MVIIEWAPESVWTFGKEINSLTLSGIEPQGVYQSIVKNVQLNPREFIKALSKMSNFSFTEKKENYVNRLST